MSGFYCRSCSTGGRTTWQGSSPRAGSGTGLSESNSSGDGVSCIQEFFPVLLFLSSLPGAWTPASVPGDEGHLHQPAQPPHAGPNHPVQFSAVQISGAAHKYALLQQKLNLSGPREEGNVPRGHFEVPGHHTGCFTCHISVKRAPVLI